MDAINPQYITIITLFLSFLGGAGGVAIINGLNDRWKFKASRKAQKEDKAIEQNDKTAEISGSLDEFRQKESETNKEFNVRLQMLERRSEAQSEALKLILLNMILEMGQQYIKDGEIAFEDRRRFNAMHNCYHTSLNGNGDADFIVNAVNELPLKA